MKKWLIFFVGGVLFFNHFALAQQDISDAIGQFNNKKYKEAYEILSKESNSNNPKALFYIGVMLDKGLGTSIDQESANKALLKSSELGNLAARLYLTEKGAVDIGPNYLDELTKLRLSLRQEMKDKGTKFDSMDEPELRYRLSDRSELTDKYFETNKKIELWAEDEPLKATFIGSNAWQVGDALLYLYVDKKSNPEHSLIRDWHTKYLVAGSWAYFIPHSQSSYRGTFSLVFASKKNYDEKCYFFGGVESDQAINYERLFKSCYVMIFHKKENAEEKLIASVVFANFETAGLAYQGLAKSIDRKGKNLVVFQKMFLGLIIFIAGFFILKKVILVTREASKKATKEIKSNISNIKSNINESRIKRKFEDTVVEETIKQQIRENNRVEEEIDKAIIKEVVKREVENNNSIDLTKLKEDIIVALKDGNYDKVKELTELVEKISKLN